MEIERKFLVKVASLPSLGPGCEIVQGYLSFDPQVRVRTVQLGCIKQAFITYKGRGERAREEIEAEILHEKAREMLAHCQGRLIRKSRYVVPAKDDLHWEIDEFLGELQGLWVAEIELEAEDQEIAIPAFVGREISDESRFKNIVLAQNRVTAKDLS